MSNYERVTGTHYSRWTDKGDDAEVNQNDATVEELYFDGHSGTLDLHVSTEDGHLSIHIPVTHSKKWREFVQTLPGVDGDGE